MKSITATLVAFSLCGCSIIGNVNADRQYNKFKYECLGQKKTASCLNLKINVNINGIQSHIDAFHAQRKTKLAHLTDQEFSAGISALERVIELEEDDRPNLLSRWILGSLPPFTTPKLPVEILRAYEIEHMFLYAAESKRLENGGAPGEILKGRPATLGSLEHNRSIEMAAAAAAEPLEDSDSTSQISDAESLTESPEATQIGAMSSTPNEPSVGFKPSFDCARSNTDVEKMICGSADLASLDLQISEAYSAALQCTSAPDDVKSDQRLWVKGNRNICQDGLCLTIAMQERVNGLRAICR